MSNENDKSRRHYKLGKRAEQQEQTRLRITEAAVQLHGTVGPARTSISELAKLAGVRRMTVYNHFATDYDLIDACSSHWFTRNMPPDAERWMEVADPGERILVALGELYSYFRTSEYMLENVLRDAPLVPALQQILQEKWWPMVDRMVDILSRGINSGSSTSVQAALHLVLDFATWKTLTKTGITDEEAVRIGGRIVLTVEG
jgi:AcrR family transcriptional regulator